MLKQIELRHFKCFEVLKLPLAPLTLLAGANASGKSTVLQALALLHQKLKDSYWSDRLSLNGSLLRLGCVADVIDQVHGRRSCSVSLVDESATVRADPLTKNQGHVDGKENRIEWELAGAPAETSLRITRLRSGEEWGDVRSMGGLFPLEAEVGGLSLRLESLTYLTAERLGPRDFYDFQDLELEPGVGAAGEHAVGLLQTGRDELVLPSLALSGVPPTRLRQAEARMRTFFPGCGLDVQRIPQANVIGLGLRISEDTPFHRPIHTGFGLTQALPIVVAALSARPDALLLIENPEVHLHPAGQARMGTFLAEVAAAGVQVLVESHSDHVLNGIRRAAKTGVLEPEDAALHFFSPRSAEAPQVQTPTMGADGRLDFWPDGFFDQLDKDLSALAGWN